MDELEEVVAVLNKKREDTLARMEKGWGMILNEEDAAKRVKLEARYELYEKVYNRLILALAILRLDHEGVCCFGRKLCNYHVGNRK